jgi:CDP-paratose 2-epimerase
MNILVTGGCGVIGSHIARKHIELGDSVTIIDACEAPRNQWIAKQLESEAVILRGRLEEHGDHLQEILKETEAVIHCAASTGIPYSVFNPSEDWRSNVDATKVLLDALHLRPVPTVVLSSIKPYRVQPLPPNGLTENAILDPDEPYAASKASQSMLCLAYAHSYNLPLTVFRCSNLYGPAPCHGPRHGWLTWFCISAAIGRSIEIQGTGEQTRDMLHAEDVFTACLSALDSIEDLQGQVFNLGGGAMNRISIKEAAYSLTLMSRCRVTMGEARAMDDSHVFVDHSAFTRLTGWTPGVSVKDGLQSVYRWAVENRAELKKLYEGL